ncbi:MAG TPA: OsmC family protein [Aromatoleum sp.]|uniref:OsmC family protein n=1 Tax=Aromatoleum sp. TaxID=2307007 RepID=UPI002B498838|nr:OsmC family protein [Aromatoleum sp.]HJV26184.1 OsmC family protein [Aromatoleum sp.]
MLEYDVFAQRLSAHGSVATTKCAEVALDTNLDGREDAFNPAELLLAVLSACMLKGIERVTPILKFEFRGVAVRIHGWRQEAPPKMARIEYTVWVDCDESDRRLELLHENLKKYGTVFNTVAAGCELTGTLRRGLPD